MLCSSSPLLAYEDASSLWANAKFGSSSIALSYEGTAFISLPELAVSCPCVNAFKASSDDVVASSTGFPNLCTEASDSPNLPRSCEAADPNADNTFSLLSAVLCPLAMTSPVPQF